MTRYSDWHGRLDKFLIANRTTPFAWGTWDCSLWVASAIEAMTGVDIAADYRGTYSTQTGAAKVCIAACGKPDIASMAEFVAQQNGMKEVPPLMAQRGDMVLTTQQCMGIVALTGHQVMVIPESGFQLVDLAEIVRAWRVG